MEKTIPPLHYSFEQHYTGYFPNPGIEFVGNGIAVTDRAITWQGEFGNIPGFPNGGKDLVNPPTIDEYEVYTFLERVKPLNDKDGTPFESAIPTA